MPDQYELERYLNVLHETDRHLGRLFDTVRRLKLDQDTLIVVMGDHGQAFGYPHNTYIQGRTMYEEDVHVPLMFWFPRRYQMATRSNDGGRPGRPRPDDRRARRGAAGAGLAGTEPLRTTRSSRAYFYVAEDHFTLGLREGNWKYIFALREGVEELYDLDKDPDEQHNLAKARARACGPHAAAAGRVDRGQPPAVPTGRPHLIRSEVTQRPCRHCVRDRAPGHLAHSPACRIAHRRHGYTVVWLKSLHAAHQLSTTLRETPNIDVDSLTDQELPWRGRPRTIVGSQTLPGEAGAELEMNQPACQARTGSR